MKRTTRRTGVAAAATVCGVLLLTGCNSHPGQAAYVGNASISTNTLQGVVNRSLQQSDCGKAYAGQPVVLERAKLSDLIRQGLLQQLADRLGISVTQADVGAALRAESDTYGGQRVVELQASRGGAIAPQDLPANIRTQVLQQKIGDQLTAGIPTSDAQLQSYYKSHIDQYLYGHARDMIVTSKQTADAIVSLVKGAPDSFGALLRKQADDQQAAGLHPSQQEQQVFGAFVGLNPKSVVDNGGYIGLIPLSQLGAQGYPVNPGSVFAVQLSNGWNVVQILDRQSFSDVKQQVRRDMLASQRQAALGKALAEQAARTPVHVNPRFGTWDTAKAAVVPATGAPVKSSGTQQPAGLQCGQGQQPQG